MWRNYLTVAVRALGKSRTYSVINALGLAIGMAACLLILLFIRYETSYDRWIPDVANTYQLQAWYPQPSSGAPIYVQMSSYITAERLKKDFPQVERTVYALGGSPVLRQDGQVSTAQNYLAVDGDFLAVVELPLVRGARNALAVNDTAVLTEAEAVRRFGTADVLGRTLTLIQRGQNRDYRITGVLRDLPKASHLKINAIVRRDFPSYFATQPQFLTCWSCQSGWVYVKLKPGSDPAAIAAGLPAWEKRNIPDDLSSGIRYNAGDEEDWHLVNLADIHLGRAQGGAMTPGNEPKTIVTFAVIAALILGMAVVNFVNLATARASQRAREVALRKVLGAHRHQLIAQFVGESVLMAAVAMLLALALLELAVRPFGAFLGADLAFDYLGVGGVLLPAAGLTLLVGVAGGIYPAFFVSRFQPAQVLKANRSAAETPGSGRLRGALVVAQFAVSIGLIACTAVIHTQSVYARAVDPGYARDHLLQVDNMSRVQLLGKGHTVAEQMKGLDGVIAVGLTDIGIATDNNNNIGIVVPGQPKAVTIGNYRVDVGFFDAMGLALSAGRWFDKREADDSYTPFPADRAAEAAVAQRGINIVVNELAARQLGFASPQAAVGQAVRSVYFSEAAGLVPLTIVGVVKDSRFRSVRQPIDALMFVNSHSNSSYMVVRYRGDPAAVRARVAAKWQTLVNDVPLEARFSDDIMLELYRAEDARARMFAGFALLAVVIACLGLFGLAAFTAERRTKEIGIRKVLGARTRDIVRLLAWQFAQPVILANLVAWPVAWWLMRDWLNTFDARIALGPMPFLIAGCVALAIAIGTIAGHALRVARAKPIVALRYE